MTRWLVGIAGARWLYKVFGNAASPATLGHLGGSLAVGADRRRRSVGGATLVSAIRSNRAGRRRDDLVHDASADSFPASDAPSWTPMVGTGLNRRTRSR
jgi:hypothetical protein